MTTRVCRCGHTRDVHLLEGECLVANCRCANMKLLPTQLEIVREECLSRMARILESTEPIGDSQVRRLQAYATCIIAVNALPKELKG